MTEADYREGRISDAEYDAAMDEYDRADEERLGRSLEKYSVGNSDSKIPKRLLHQAYTRRPISLSKKDWSKVNNARAEKYRGLDQNQIPEVDFFPLAEYNELNIGHMYVIRNYGIDTFAVISKKRLTGRYDGYLMEAANDGRTVQKIDEGAHREGVKQRGQHLGNQMPGDGGTLSGDAERSGEYANAEPGNSSADGGPDSGSAIKTSPRAKFSVSGSSIFGDKDSDGYQLSKEQQEYFTDSKVRLDEEGEYWYGEGRLAPVYHATDAEFTTFLKKYIGKSTERNAFDNYLLATAYTGFWFNSSDPVASRKMGGRSIKAYLNARRLYDAGTLEGLANEIWDSAEGVISPKRAAKIFTDGIKSRGYDGIVIRDEEMGGVSFVVFESNQIKDVSNKLPTAKKDIRYSFSDTLTEEENRRPMEGSYTTDEVEMQARKKGYPVLHGEQVVPFRTWVQTTDRGNYGLVTGLAAGNKLLVSFHNKHDGGTADNVAIAYENLKPVPGAYQMTKEEFASLMASEPMDPGSQTFSEEEMREIEELYNQAKGGEEKAANPIDLDKLPRKAQNYLKRAQRKLLNSLCERLGVPRSAMREHLQGMPDLILTRQRMFLSLWTSWFRLTARSR